MEFDPSYAYLHYDLLDKVLLIKIILKVKSPHIKLCEQHLQKGMLVKVKNVSIESKYKKVYEKGDMHVVNYWIPLKLVKLCFFTWIP
jgi:hypothetical protein